VLINNYRDSLGLSHLEYVKELNPILRMWAEDFTNNRMTSVFTLNDSLPYCVHYKCSERVDTLKLNANIKKMNGMAEIAVYSTYTNSQQIKNDLAYYDFYGWKNSPKHHEIMKEPTYNYFSVGIFYNKKTTKYTAYVIFFRAIICGVPDLK